MSLERKANVAGRDIARVVLVAALAGWLTAGCSDVPVEQDFPDKQGGVYRSTSYFEKRKNDTIFGDDSLDLFGGRDRRAQQGGGIGVNSFLWRATLDTVSFMPLASADPFGGVIITDWYSPPEAPQERYKMSVYILGRELRADGVKVAVFRQRLNGNGWAEAAVAKETAGNLEDQILTRARQLRIAQQSQR